MANYVDDDINADVTFNVIMQEVNVTFTTTSIVAANT